MNTASTSAALDPARADLGNGTGSAPIMARDDILYEVVNGQIVEKTVGVYEGDVATLLITFLAPFVRAHRLGRVLGATVFRIDQSHDLQRRPDVAFVSHSRWPAHLRAPKVAVWDMVPDLAVEIVSPSNTADQVQEKVHEYFRAGVNRVWVVYPRQQEIYDYASPTQIHVLQLGQELDGGELIPGFRLAVAVLFEDEPE